VSRAICVVTGTRAEYGLLRGVMDAISREPLLDLQIVATGAHLAPEFGLTYRDIEADGFSIGRRVEMLISSDTASAVAKSIGLGVMGLADAFAGLRPDVVVVLGDRYEILAAATAATVARLPLAHIHGGETTEGAFDEVMRHAITKMSHLHFVAAEPYRRRVIQMGEDPARVFLVGGLGIDAIARLELLSRPELEASLGACFGDRNLVVTFHPPTLDECFGAVEMRELLAALDRVPDVTLFFTMPNADTGNQALRDLVSGYVARRANAHAFTSLGHLRYLSTIAQSDGVVGNSSSGLTEVPSLHKGTINIGDRQRGRLRASSVIDCEPDSLAIAGAIERLYSASFQEALPRVTSPYGERGASDRIVDVLRQYPLDGILKKSFYDLPIMSGAAG
jgi:GDP/UDP-N,N'-diacetylbacillosamine 2-epimerase (hydrolysing)